MKAKTTRCENLHLNQAEALMTKNDFNTIKSRRNIMNIIASTDSPILYNGLVKILSELPEIEIIGVTKDLNEAEVAISKYDVHVFIIVFHNMQKSVFNKLKEIKEHNHNLVVIVLSNNPADQYFTQWKNAGADYVFDLAFHFNKVVDVLSGYIYKNLLESLRSNTIQ
jgi:DNA-binding NarL/FixJ family response regulator